MARHCFEMMEKPLGGLCRPAPAIDCIKQFQSKRSFKARHSSADRGFIQPESLAGGGVGAAFLHGCEDLKVVPIYVHGLHFCSPMAAILRSDASVAVCKAGVQHLQQKASQS